MKRILTILAMSALLPVHAEQTSSANTTVEDSWTRIQNGLLESVQIAGEKTVTHEIGSRLKALNIPGVSIAVSYDGEIIHNKAYGVADVSESRQMTTSTMLLAGSISKPVAALRALQLHEKGKMLLDENINKYLTSWSLPDNEFTQVEKVTLRRILNHTAGLTVWGFPGYDKGDEIPSTVEVLDGKSNTDPVRVYKTPGGDWQYSGGGYTVMQLAIEDVEKSPFASVMQETVLNPLNMQKSTFENPLPKQYHSIAATGYRYNGDEVEGKWPIYPEMAAAGLWTTPEQLIQYAIEVQRIINTGQDGVIDHNTALEMLISGDNNHGLGPAVNDDYFGHGGADEGFRARLVAWKDKPYALVAMVNSDNGRIVDEIIRAVAAEYDLPGFEPTIKTVVELTELELKQFVGRYDAGDSGIFEISLTDTGLSVFVVNYDYTTALLPQSDNVFFERQNGIEMTFVVEEGKVTKINWRDMTATRID